MQFAHNGYYKGSNPLGLNLNCYILYYNIYSPRLLPPPSCLLKAGGS